MISRRKFLGLVGAGTLSTLAYPRSFLAEVVAQTGVQPFQVPLRIPPVLKPHRRDGKDYFSLTMRPAPVEIIPGKRTTIWGFNGRFPGPTIKVKRGQPAVVRQINQLEVPTTIHLHGGHVPAASDGHPLDLIRPGRAKHYHYPNDQLGATLWYHDHTHHETSRNIYRGLAGLYVIEDESEKALNLPKGIYDMPLIIQDRAFKADGSFAFKDDHDDVLGDVYLVNGRPMPYLKVANRRYRFRILNGSNSRNYTLALDSMQPLTQIAGDGGLLPSPHTAESIQLWPAERAEVVVDFSLYPIGTKIVLQDRATGITPLEAAPIMRFEVDRDETDDSAVPSTLRPRDRLGPSEAERDFELSLDVRRGLWLINGKTFDPRRIDVRPRLDRTETWTFRNISAVTHPMHIHLAMFQILDRDGLPPDGGETGWKDTVRVDARADVRVAIRFTKQTGTYVFHCHNLAHEDHVMMAQMKVVR